MIAGANPSNRIWEAIDREKRRDALLKRVSMAAWAATLVLVTVLLVIGGISAAQMVRAAVEGAVPWATVLGTVIPLIVVLGVLTVLIAVVSTVAIFLRMRTATLQEIQLRLAALEEALMRGSPS
jgi:hypothetical protein